MPKIKVVNNKRFSFFCPGCQELHGVNETWQFNQDVEKPTFTPSILVEGTQWLTDDEHQRIMNGEKIQPKPLVCHSFITDGKIQFLADSTHHLAGQTVELEEFHY